MTYKCKNKTLAVVFQKDQIKVYPNPVSNVLTIETSLEVSVNIIVNDFNGKIVKQFSTSKGVFDISMLNVASGVYFVTVSTDTQKSTFKIVKE